MSLDGLRAWIAEVEHKLRMRTRVFLALAAIAVGIAAAGIFLAIDTRNGSVSEGDVRELQEKLELRIDEVEERAGEAEADTALAPEAGGTGSGLGETGK